MAVLAPAPDGSTVNYLVTAASLDAGVEIDARDGIEDVGSAAWGIDGYPAVWMEDGLTIHRWGLRDDGSLALEETLSLANLGVELNQWQGAFVSPALAVADDNGISNELVRWNPTTMEIEQALPLGFPGPAEDRYPQIWESKVRPDGTIITSTSYCLDDACASPVSGLLTFNADATEIIGRDEWQVPDGRAMLFARGGLASDGTVYAGPIQACTEDETGNPPTCGPLIVNRVAPGSTTYDRNWQANLHELTGLGPDWGGGDVDRKLHVAGDQIFFALHQTTPEGTATATKWFVTDTEFSAAREIPNGGFIGDTSAYVLAVDGRLFIPDWLSVWDPDFNGNTPFYEITPDGLVPAFSIAGAGLVYNILRIR